MTIFAAQYLESAPKGATPSDVCCRLQRAFERLPISLILLGWNLPPKLEEAVARETSRLGVSLFRWQPWLTGDARTDIPAEWQITGPGGSTIPGHNDAPEFTFICPNRNSVGDFLNERVEAIAALGIYQGIFLDRIRFPSPAKDPLTHLGCFCKHCISLAADEGLDLIPLRQYILNTTKDVNAAQNLACNLLGQPDENNLFNAFINFRCHSITRTVITAKRQTESFGLSLGLDCFSPSLARMVGQDLHDLQKTSDWIKLMIYPRVHGPAGLPFELANLTLWLKQHGSTEQEALKIVSDSTGLTLSESSGEPYFPELNPSTVEKEISLGRQLGITNLLAGVAMVNMKGIHWATKEQIRSDLSAARSADGLVISWDLWQTPLEHLDMIRAIWEI